MTRPFASLVLAYCAGLLLAQFEHPPLAALAAIAAALLFAALFAKPLRPWLVWPLLALLGWANLESRTTVIGGDDLRLRLGNQPALVALRGVLLETPRQKIITIDGREMWRSLARIRTTALGTNETFQPATGEVLAIARGVLGPEFFAGQPVELSGVIARPAPPVAEGLFDYPNYLATRGIYYQLKTDSIDDWTLRQPASTMVPVTDRFLSWSRRTLALGLPAEDQPLRLLWAMTLGWKTAFTGDINEPFLRAGTQHLFAIDGLRIALLAGMIVTLLRVFRLARSWCGAVAIPMIWFYTAATGWESSAVRASVMMTIVLGGWALKRPGDLLNSLAAAALIILIAEPRQLFEASFQLSFFVMLVIALMLPPLNKYFDSLLHLDPLLPVELASRWKTWLLKASRITLRYFGLSFAAWLGSLPLAAKYFHLLSPVSTLANVVAVPLGTGALMANLGALICGTWFPWATELFNHAAWFLMVAMTWVSEQATRLPGAYFYVPEPSFVTIALYYAVLIAAFSGWFKTSRRITGGLAILLVIGGVYLWQWQCSRGETDLTVLPLGGGGHAVYVDADGRAHDWLINSGTEDSVELTLKNYLRAEGVNHLPRLVLTEGDIRSCGGAPSLDRLFGVDELWTGTTRFRSTEYRATVATFEKPANRHKFMNYGDTIGPWQVLFPDTTNALAKAADKPLILRGNFAGTKILLLSDLSRSGQSDLLAHTNYLPADIVIAGLPDDGEPLCNALIDAIQPKVIVITDVAFPPQYRASAALRERLAQTKIPVLYTRNSGAVRISTDKSGWKLETMDGQALHGDIALPK